MKQTVILVTLAGVVLMAACGESSLPVATGKANIRAINAIKASPNISFKIEERTIGDVSYKSVSPQGRYDDLDYTFNFDVFFAGDTARTRVASEQIDFVTDQDYTLLISGTLATPVVTLWETAARTFTVDETIFQARFAHTATTLGTVDYYFAAAGVAPVMGQEVATLSFGQITDPIDLEAGPYVITITTAGDPLDIIYTSDEAQMVAQAQLIITPFDGDTDDVAPIIVRSLGALGSAVSLTDSSYPATVEFLHASIELGIADIYDDETLLSQVVAGHAYKSVSAEIPIAAGEHTFRYTPAGGTTAVTLEGTLTADPGVRYRFVALGNNGNFSTAAVIPGRRPVDSFVRILLLQTSANFAAVDFYAVAVGTEITDVASFLFSLAPGVPAPAAGHAAGSFDLYVTDSGTKDILAGPTQVDFALGDVVDIVIFDTVDPAVLEMQILAAP